MSIEAVQIPVHQKEKLIGHYVDIIKKKASQILRYTGYLVVDGYFIKKVLYRTGTGYGVAGDHQNASGC